MTHTAGVLNASCVRLYVRFHTNCRDISGKSKLNMYFFCIIDILLQL